MINMYTYIYIKLYQNQLTKALQKNHPTCPPEFADIHVRHPWVSSNSAERSLVLFPLKFQKTCDLCLSKKCLSKVHQKLKKKLSIPSRNIRSVTHQKNIPSPSPSGIHPIAAKATHQHLRLAHHRHGRRPGRRPSCLLSVLTWVNKPRLRLLNKGGVPFMYRIKWLFKEGTHLIKPWFIHPGLTLIH